MAERCISCVEDYAARHLCVMSGVWRVAAAAFARAGGSTGGLHFG
jgi:hypothetical protein